MTRRAAIRFTVAAAVVATGLAGIAASGAVALIETRALSAVQAVLEPSDAWVELSTSGTVLRVMGTAPDGAAQIAALSRIGKASQGLTVVDLTAVGTGAIAAEAAKLEAAAPPPKLEILRDGPSITMFGQVPGPDLEAGRFAMLPGLDLDAEVAPMLTPSGNATPEGWDDSVALALAAVPLLDRMRAEIAPGSVTISGAAGSEELRASVTESLEEMRGDHVALTLDITAPRPVIAPFTFRAEWTPGETPDFPACTAETEDGRNRIVAAAAALGATPDCQIGLGAPSPDWAVAVTSGLAVLEHLGGGTLEITDADIAITGPKGHEATDFAAQVEWLVAQLPQVFSVAASLPALPQAEAKAAEGERPPHFTAVRDAGGAAHIRGDLTDALLQQTAETYAEAQFGFDSVVNETATRDDLPPGWTAQVLGGLEALGLLSGGQLDVSSSAVALTGVATAPRTEEEIRAVLAARLPGDVDVELSIRVEEPAPGPQAVAVPAELCAEQIALVLDDNQIIFPPSETSITNESAMVVDRIAEILVRCPGARFEIGGHTDSQGGEGSNMALSQARADAVLTALLERQVDTVFLYAKGYGESQPIASNEEEEGRALNRRIEFRLLTGEQPAAGGADAAAPGATMATAPADAAADAETAVAEADVDAAAEAEGDAATQGEDLPIAARAAGGPTEVVTTVSDDTADAAAAQQGATAANAADAEEEAAATATAPAEEPDPAAGGGPPRPMPRPAGQAAGGD